VGILRRQPFHRQVVMAAAVLLLPLLVAIVFSARRTRAERQGEVQDTAVSVAVTAAALLDESLRSLDALASGVVRHPAVLGLDAAQSDTLFRTLLRQQPLLTNLALVDRDGLVRGSALPMDGTHLERPWITEVLNTGTPRVSDFQVGSITKKPTVILAYPIAASDQRVVGVFGLTIDLTRLQDVFAKIPLPDGTVIEVFDRSNRVLVRTRDAERFVGQTVSGLDWSGLPRTTRRVDVDGVERYSGEASAARVPWVVSVGVPLAVVPASLAPLWQRNIAIALTALLGSVVLLLFISRIVSRHIESLRQAAQRIADGDLSPPVVAPVPNLELSRLQETFISMAANLRAAREALDRRMEQERRMNETLTSLQRRVVRQERLAAVGLLASGIAHEINNPLQAIVGAAELLERSGGPGAGAQAQIAAIKTQGTRAREIIRSLAHFATPTARPLSAVQLGDVVEEVLRARDRSELEPSATIEVDIASTRAVHASLDDLAQVGSHFLANAIQAITSSNNRRGGRIAIRVHDVGRRVRFEVEDNGPGVAAEHESKLFQPFFTTRPVGTGMGMSLSASYGIIHSLGGTIGYERPAGGGALFFFELPTIDASDLHHDDRTAVLQRPVST
jgi:C4-dicarboxylate-specific signal transduction histidine kinase